MLSSIKLLCTLYSKDSFGAKGYVKKDTIEDLDDVRKNVVDDIKTAIEKKNDIIKALGNRYELGGKSCDYK